MEISYKRITKGEHNDSHSETENSIWEHCDWVIERTFAWLSTWRRLAKDYELLPSSEEAWICLAMIRLMLRRVTQNSS